MANCPQCQAPVGLRAILGQTGVSHLLRQASVGSAWELLGLIATMTAVWLALRKLLVRLRVKVTSVSSLRETH